MIETVAVGMGDRLTFALDKRTGWPSEMRFLIERHPRETWQSHANLGEMTRFWLERHGMFRSLGGALSEETARFREGKVGAAEFQAWFVPRLQFFLSQLNAHHHIEDHHYFPLFQNAEPRLQRGFDVLESDHEVIHEAILGIIDPANALLRSIAGPADATRTAGDQYAEASDRLLSRLLRHLDDEEDLIVPLVLDRGEQKLGVA
jgi:hypothetical protein